MKRLIFACHGLTVSSIRIPPFELNAGDFICLHMPCSPFSHEEDEVVAVFTGEHPLSGCRPFGRIRRAFAPVCRGGVMGIFRRPRAVSWLCHSAALSRAEARAVLARNGLTLDARLCELAGTPKTLLGLEAAWALGAEGIVFRTVGLDPLGVRAVYSVVSGRLNQCAALHLSYAFEQNGRAGRECYPGGSCNELTKQIRSPAAFVSSPKQG